MKKILGLLLVIIMVMGICSVSFAAPKQETITIKLSNKGTPLANTKVYLVNNQYKAMALAKTDQKGKATFKVAPATLDIIIGITIGKNVKLYDTVGGYWAMKFSAPNNLSASVETYGKLSTLVQMPGQLVGDDNKGAKEVTPAMKNQ